MPHESLVTMPSAQESVAAATAMFDDSTKVLSNYFIIHL